MRCIVDLREVLPVQGCIDLCGCQVGMPQKFLYRAQLSAVFEQVGCERMAKPVRMETDRQPGLLGPLRYPKLNTSRGQAPTTAGDTPFGNPAMTSRIRA